MRADEPDYDRPHHPAGSYFLNSRSLILSHFQYLYKFKHKQMLLPFTRSFIRMTVTWCAHKRKWRNLFIFFTTHLATCVDFITSWLNSKNISQNWLKRTFCSQFGPFIGHSSAEDLSTIWLSSSSKLAIVKMMHEFLNILWKYLREKSVGNVSPRKKDSFYKNVVYFW